MIKLSFPFTEEKIRALKVGDEVLISGVVFTGRDAVHKYLHEGGKLPPGVSLRDGILYHCGPVVMKQDDGTWKATAAGPTTSIREEPYQAQIIRDFGIRGVIGKGGMGDQTLAACKRITAACICMRWAVRRRCWRNASRRCAMCISTRNLARRKRSGNLRWKIFRRW